MDFRPCHTGGRRRASDVSARLQRGGAGGNRCAHARRPPEDQRRSRAALKAYEAARSGAGGEGCSHQPRAATGFINIKVEELVGDKPFDNLDAFITQDELRALSENYKRVAGFALTDVAGDRFVDSHILIVGCGAIGGLFASALAKVAAVTAYDANASTSP